MVTFVTLFLNAFLNIDFFAADGKCLGPDARKISHLKEFKKHPDDMTILPRGSEYRSRMFLNLRKERELLKDLLKENITVEEFLEVPFTTSNGVLVQNLVSRIQLPEGEIPTEYKDFMKDLAEPTPVCGYLQATSQDSLNILYNFADEELDLRSTEQSDQVDIVEKDFPTFWESMKEILIYEKHLRFLPRDVAQIVKKLVEIRMSTFSESAKRYDENYFDYSDTKELSTQCYMNWPPLRHPAEYNIRSEGGKKNCSKKFPKNSKFAPGMFQIFYKYIDTHISCHNLS